MMPRQSLPGLTLPDWPIPCHRFPVPDSPARLSDSGQRPLLVWRSSRDAAASGSLWMRPIHRLDGGDLSGAELVTRPAWTDAALTNPWMSRTSEPTEDARWLLNEGVRQASQFGRPLMLCLPMPAGIIMDAALVEHHETALRGARPSRCVLEISLSGPEIADAGADHLLALSALRDAGCGIAHDVGGRGTHDLARIGRMPLTSLRLPASLVRDMPHSRPARNSVAEIGRLAHTLGATVMGLGVQTAAQRDILAELGCRYGQGPLFGGPMPADTFQAADRREPP